MTLESNSRLFKNRVGEDVYAILLLPLVWRDRLEPQFYGYLLPFVVDPC
jgi:hypothetical protein